jgi:hypothetical protein
MSNENCKGLHESNKNTNSGGLFNSDGNEISRGLSNSHDNKFSYGLHRSNNNKNSNGLAYSNNNKNSNGLAWSEKNKDSYGLYWSDYNIKGRGLYKCMFTQNQVGKAYMFFDAQLTEEEIGGVMININCNNDELSKESIEYIKNRPEFIAERFEEITGITLDDYIDCRHGKYDSPYCPDCGEELK